MPVTELPPSPEPPGAPPVPASLRVPLAILATCAGFAALRLGQNVFAPMLLALVIGVVLSPLSDWLVGAGLPRVAAALAGLAVAMASIVGIALLAEPLVWRVIDRLPVIWQRIGEILAEAQGMLGTLSGAPAPVVGAAPAAPAGEAPAMVTDALPSLTDALFLAPSVAAQVLVFVGTLFFFLLSRVEVYEYLSRHRVLSHRPRDVGPILLAAERRVSRYFLTITVINAGFGTVVAAAMWAVGMPAPLLWGMIAFLANFILYLGPAVVSVMLLVAGSMNFGGLQAFAPALVFVGINALEGQFVTPGLVGRQLEVSPLLVFLSLVFWLWLWGPIGGIVAIPLLVWAIAVATPAARDASPGPVRHGTPSGEGPRDRTAA